MVTFLEEDEDEEEEEEPRPLLNCSLEVSEVWRVNVSPRSVPQFVVSLDPWCPPPP